MTDTSPPHDVEAERAFLGSLMVDRDAIAQVAGMMPVEAFYFSSHQELYRAMLALWDRRVPIDSVTLSAELEQRKLLERIGIGYLGTLVTSVPTAVHLPFYADVILDRARRRALIDGASDMVRAGYQMTAEPDIDEMLVSLRERIDYFRPVTVSDSVSMDEWAMSHAETVVDKWAGLREDVVIPTGLRGVDRLLNGGFRPKQLCILAARPGMGKTSLALQLALRSRTMFFSLEMGREEVTNRLVSMVADVPYAVAHADIGSVSDREKWIDGAERLAQMPIYVNDRSALTTMKMRSEVERRVAEDGIELVIVDHLDHAGDVTRAEVEQRTAQIVRRFQNAAKETGVPWVVLSQLNRNVEHRTGCVPLLSDLRNSGAVEQDADVVILLYRRRYYSERNYPGVQADSELDYVRASNQHRVDVIVAKNRNGPVSSIQVGWQPETMAFKEIAS